MRLHGARTQTPANSQAVGCVRVLCPDDQYVLLEGRYRHIPSERTTCERITRDVPDGKRGNSFNRASSGCPGFHLRRPSARTGLPVLFSSPTSLATPSLDRLTPSCVISKLQPARGHQPAPDSDRPSSVACRQLLFCGSLHAGWLLAKVRMSPQVLAGEKPGCTPCRSSRWLSTNDELCWWNGHFQLVFVCLFFRL